ncbi:hypothetical protein DITRI_Ditri15bG0093300 [Diplodiscus trichospermus]
MDPNSLPFEVGQLVETRSFLAGYRGAWFRCKIKDIGQSNRALRYALEYIDFPDEKILWTRLYQKGSKAKNARLTLMVRPQFPSLYRESQMPDVNTILEEVVIVNDVWKVGDLVDWWTDNCFWSGRITEKLGDEKFKIELPPPPVGEGSSYEVFGADLRPSLDWFVGEGWKLPIAKENKYHLCCARIIKPFNQGCPPNLIDHAINERKKDVKQTAGSSFEREGSLSSHILTGPVHLPDKPEQLVKKPLNGKLANSTEKIIGLNVADHAPIKTSCPDSVSSSHIQDTLARMPGSAIQKEKYDESGSSKMMKINQSICLNSTSSDTVEAAILDLEELICRVKWLKRMLEFGMPLSDSLRPSWRFIEHRGSSTPK